MTRTRPPASYSALYSQSFCTPGRPNKVSSPCDSRLCTTASPPVMRVILKFRDGRARTHEVAISMHIVDSPYRRPILVRSVAAGGEAANGPRVWPAPSLIHEVQHRMRRATQRRFGENVAPTLDLANLRADAHHGVAEPIELALGFGFRGFDHQRARNRKTHGRRVKAEIDQPFGDVVHRDSATVFEHASIDDALMRDASRGIAIEHLEMPIQAPRHVVRGEYRDFTRTFQAGAAHQPDIHVGNRQD